MLISKEDIGALKEWCDFVEKANGEGCQPPILIRKLIAFWESNHNVIPISDMKVGNAYWVSSAVNTPDMEEFWVELIFYRNINGIPKLVLEDGCDFTWKQFKEERIPHMAIGPIFTPSPMDFADA